MREWIDIKEKWPDRRQFVLAYNSKTNHQHDVISVQFFQVPSMYAPEQEYDWGFATRENGKNITHWMPLPKPPEVLE